MLRVAVVGLGWWGQALVQAVQGKSRRIRVLRGVSPRPDELQNFANDMGIRIDTDYAGALGDPAIGAVVLATPHSQHVDQIVRAAEAGKHVFCEKPLALEASEARRAFAACKAAGVVLAVGHNMRFLPAAQHLAKLVAEGALGKPMHVEGHYSGPSAYRRAPGSWRLQPSESPLGGMTGMGVHLSDLMIAIFDEVEEVWAQSTRQVIDADLDDTTAMLLRFRSGMTGSLTTLTATADLWRLSVLGSKGWAEMRGLRRVVSKPIDGEEQTVDFPAVDIERAELEAFADAVEGKAAYPIRGDQVIANIALLEAARQSARESGPARFIC